MFGIEKLNLLTGAVSEKNIIGPNQMQAEYEYNRLGTLRKGEKADTTVSLIFQNKDGVITHLQSKDVKLFK